MLKENSESRVNSNRTFEIPKTLEAFKGNLYHEAGHIATARALDVEVWGYNVNGEIKWISDKMPADLRTAYEKQAGRFQGFVSIDPKDVTEVNKKLLAAGGAAGELIALGYITGDARELAQDKSLGGIANFKELQETADVVADKLETGEWRDIFIDTLEKMSTGQAL